MKRGQSGVIHLCNQTLDVKTINFDNYCFTNTNENLIDGNYTITKLNYTVIDENNLEILFSKGVIPHLPIQIGSGNYLAINSNGDALLN
jgi:hypothetical protein